MNKPRPNALTAKLPNPIHSMSVRSENGDLIAVQTWRTSYSIFSHRVELSVNQRTSDNAVRVITGNTNLILNPGTIHVHETNVTDERVSELIKSHLGYDVEVANWM